MATRPKRPKRKKRTAPAIEPSKKVEARYRSDLFNIVNTFQDKFADLAYRVQLGMVTVSEANKELENISKNIKGLNYDKVVKNFIEDSDKANIESLSGMFNKTFGINVFKTIKKKSIKKVIDNKTINNINLIKTIPSNQFDRVQQAILDNFMGKPKPEGMTLVRQIQGIGIISKNRARVIARDQTSKLNSAINQARQTALGITKYIWRTSKDERVVGRPGGVYPTGNPKHMNHYKREGKEFSWDDPPPDGHPGEPIQ